MIPDFAASSQIIQQEGVVIIDSRGIQRLSQQAID